MQRSSLAWRVFHYNLIVILFLIAVTGVAFNIGLRVYVEQDTVEQLTRIAQRAEAGARRFSPGAANPLLPPSLDDPFWNYFALDRALRESMTLVNADYILLGPAKQIVRILPAELVLQDIDVSTRIVEKLLEDGDFSRQSFTRLYLDNTEYIALIRPVPGLAGVGWIVIYSSLERLNQLRTMVNLILVITLVSAALIAASVASLLAKRIAAPFADLSRHIRAIADRNFGREIDVPVDVELQDFVDSVNTMSKRLEKYDQAQKTFLQNASHEFRTPIMAIQSYAEGIKHGVVDEQRAVDVILEETQRLTQMVEDLLYLSRLDALEEPYNFAPVSLGGILQHCLERAQAMAVQAGKVVAVHPPVDDVRVDADFDKLSRAILNVLTNCIRYADNMVEVRVTREAPGFVTVTVRDDGPGIAPEELPHIFERFYKGQRGVAGLGLAITKHIVERHGGAIAAENTDGGALFTMRLPLAAPSATA